MTKNEIVSEIQAGLARQGIEISKEAVAATIDDFFGLVTDRAGSGEDTSWPNIGKFVGSFQAAREARNPATGGTVQIPAKRVLKLKVGAGVKRQVAGA